MKKIYLVFWLLFSVCAVFGQEKNEGNTGVVVPVENANFIAPPPPPPTPPPPPLTPPPPPPTPPPPPPPPADEMFASRPQEMPRFPGCENHVGKQEKYDCAQEKLLQNLYKNLEYPETALAEKQEGMAVVQFMILEDGTMDGFKLVRDPGTGMGDAALKAARKMQEDNIIWIPGRINNKNVKVLYTLPVRFAL